MSTRSAIEAYGRFGFDQWTSLEIFRQESSRASLNTAQKTKRLIKKLLISQYSPVRLKLINASRSENFNLVNKNFTTDSYPREKRSTFRMQKSLCIVATHRAATGFCPASAFRIQINLLKPFSRNQRPLKIRPPKPSVSYSLRYRPPRTGWLMCRTAIRSTSSIAHSSSKTASRSSIRFARMPFFCTDTCSPSWRALQMWVLDHSWAACLDFSAAKCGLPFQTISFTDSLTLCPFDHQTSLTIRYIIREKLDNPIQAHSRNWKKHPGQMFVCVNVRIELV